ncbi:phosphotransferase KptA/Tpt1, partial [Hygrophoropsis aurantiaca]
KLRGSDRDAPDVRISKSLSWLLRHGAKTAGLQLRADGYAKISDVLANPLFKDVTFVKIQELVSKDLKKRYSLILEPQIPDAPYPSDIWWIRANQGHSIKDVKLDLKPILSASEIPMAIHGTTRKAWESISTQGLSKMNRNHIHLARGIARDSVISGMHSSSQILIFIDVQKALDAGTTFFLSENGVILTEGDAAGFLAPIFFRRVENANRSPVPGWEGIASDAITTTTT